MAITKEERSDRRKKSYQRAKSKRQQLRTELMRTDTTYDSIDSYILRASSDRDAYLLSTYDRYIDLKKNRDDIISRVTQSYKGGMAKALLYMADEIEKKEEVALNSFASDLGYSNYKELLRSWNGSQVNKSGQGLNQAIQASAFEIQHFYNYYRDKAINSNMPDIIEAFEKGAEPKDLKTATINYNRAARDLDKFTESFDNLIEALSDPDIYTSDLLSIRVAMSSMYLALVAAKDKVGIDAMGNSLKKAQISSEDGGNYQRMMRELLNTKAKVEANITKNLSKDNFTLSFARNRFGAGMVAEILTGYYLGKLIERDKTKVDRSSFKNTEKGMMKGVEDSIYGFFGVGSYSSTFKGGDLIYVDESGIVGIDVKVSGAVKRKELKANALYTTTFDINLGEVLLKFLRDNKSDAVARLYRSMIVNIAANEGYSLGPKERTLLLSYYLKDKKNFEDKFKMNTGEYPYLVVADGIVVTFSSVVRKMALSISEEAVQKELGTGFTVGKIPKGQINHGLNYEIKTYAYKGRRVNNFVDYIPAVARQARQIENTYKSIGTKKYVLRYRI